MKAVKIIQEFFINLTPEETAIESDFSPIFIVGPPRSGSTIISEALIANYKCAYISNLMAIAPNKMQHICSIFLKQHQSYCPKSRSEYGFIPGLFSPNECGQICEKWLSYDKSNQIIAVRNQFNRISNCLNAPIVVKNTPNSLRIPQILATFPSARIVEIQRSKIENAESILNARHSITGSKKNWWGVKPDGYEHTLRKTPEEQVAWQLSRIINIIKEEQALRPDRFRSIAYEDFVKQPLESINKLANSLGLSPQKREPICILEKTKRAADLENKALVNALRNEKLL